MDRELWTTLKNSVKRVCARLKPDGRKPTFSNHLIALMYFWSVWQGGCLGWACDKIHYGDLFRPRKLPGSSQFRRRVNQPAFQDLLQAIHMDLATAGFSSPVKYLDGKPLLVSPVSKDPDATNGHITGSFGKGYKLHAIVGENRSIIIWSVMPLNVAEQTVAIELARGLTFTPNGLMLADTNFDSAPLHKTLSPTDHRLLTPLKGQQRIKDGVHHPVTLRQMGAERREAVDVWNDHSDLAEFVLKARNNIEGVFSVMSMALNGGSPPPWVRRLSRVRRWAGAIIILYNVRLKVQAQLAKLEPPKPHLR